MALTADELYISMRHSMSGRVHRQARVPFSGLPSHHYFVDHRVSNEHLAQITHQSHNAEVALVRINDAFVVTIGSPYMAGGTVIVPQRNQGITTYCWIAHTHPLEQASRYDRVIGGPTIDDRTVLDTIYSRGFGQFESVIINCRAGSVVRVVRFEGNHTAPSIENFHIRP